MYIGDVEINNIIKIFIHYMNNNEAFFLYSIEHEIIICSKNFSIERASLDETI